MSPEIEASLIPDLRWPHVGAIPGFPVDFGALRLKNASGELVVRVAAKAALETGQWAFGKTHYLLAALFSWTPTLVAVSAIPAAFLLGRVSALLLAPAALFAFVISAPVIPGKRFFKLTAIVATGLALWFAVQGASLGALLLGGYALSFWAIRFVYAWNSLAVAAAVLESEPLFIFLFQNQGICLQDERAATSGLVRALLRRPRVVESLDPYMISLHPFS